MCEPNCCKTFSRVVLIIVNIIFWLAGCLMLALGIAIVVAPQKIFAFLASIGLNYQSFNDATGGFFDTIIQAIGIFMIILGGIVFIIAFFGFFGASCDSKCMIVTYVILMILIVCFEIALIIFAAVYPGDFQSGLNQLFDKSLQGQFLADISYNGTFVNSTSSFGELWTGIQFQFGCCGAYGVSDWTNITFTPFSCTASTNYACPVAPTNNNRYAVPISCCALIPMNGQTNYVPTNISQFNSLNACLQTGVPSIAGVAVTNTAGCTGVISNDAISTLNWYGKIAIGIAAGIVGLEIILIALAITMACMMGRTDNKYV